MALAVALARQLVRRELKTDPTQIIGIIREAIKALPVASRDVRVYLHPEDAAIVRQNLAPTGSERAWSVVEDPVMARGGCQVVSSSSRIDARLETRLTTVLTELLGEMAVPPEDDSQGRGPVILSARTTPRRLGAEAGRSSRARLWHARAGGRRRTQSHGRHDARSGGLRGAGRRPMS